LNELISNKTHVIATQQYDVFIAGWNITALSVTIIRRFYLLALAFVTTKQTLYFHTRHFPAPSRTLYYRIRVMKLALKHFSYVVTNAICAIKDARQVLAILFDARVVLRVFEVETLTRLTHKIRTVVKL
jgi:hypothetical protein